MRYSIILLFAALAALLPSCIEDGFSTSPADQPVFSTDTLDMGTLFTDEPSGTARFVVYNRHDKGMSIERIALSGPNADLFRLNVDGMSGTTFSGVEIRANDSIYVMVETTLPANGLEKPLTIDADLDFTVNGVTSTVVLSATGVDAERLKALTVASDMRLNARRPYIVYDSLVVAPGATLTLEPGTTLHFHDKALMRVRGRIDARGTVEQPVVMGGDRTGDVITDVTFDLMSRQWVGVEIMPGSTGNTMSHTIIKNTVSGVLVSGFETDAAGSATARPASLSMVNCRLTNSGGMVLEARHADIEAVGCEFSNAAEGLVYLQGGTHSMMQCTFANYYLFSAISGPALWLAHLGPGSEMGDDESGLPFTRLNLLNSILYGLGSDIAPGDLTGTEVRLNHCLLKSAGTDDDNFIDCLWDEDPLYYADREAYNFDFRLRPDSPAIGAGMTLGEPEAVKVDFYGIRRASPPALGAYTFVAPKDDDKN